MDNRITNHFTMLLAQPQGYTRSQKEVSVTWYPSGVIAHQAKPAQRSLSRPLFPHAVKAQLESISISSKTKCGPETALGPRWPRQASEKTNSVAAHYLVPPLM